MEYEFTDCGSRQWEYPEFASWQMLVYDKEPEDENNFAGFAICSELKMAVTCRHYVRYTVRDCSLTEIYAKRIVWLDKDDSKPWEWPNLFTRSREARQLLCEYLDRLDTFNDIRPLKEYPKK